MPPLFFGGFGPWFGGETRYQYPVFARKPIREWLLFFHAPQRICAYSTGLKKLLAYNEMLRKKIWRLPEVLNQTGLSRSTIYSLISQGAFPRQVKLGPRAVGWVADDVQGWIDGKINDAKID